jgi:excisionase family DNA binding protein
MTVADACRYLKVSRSTLFRYMKDGRLPSSQVPGGWGRRIKHEDLDRLLEGEAKDRRQNYG